MHEGQPCVKSIEIPDAVTDEVAEKSTNTIHFERDIVRVGIPN